MTDPIVFAVLFVVCLAVVLGAEPWDRALANRGRLRVAHQLGITLRGDFR